MTIGTLSAERLRCEYIVEPVGVDQPHPVFAWTPSSTTVADQQTAFRLLVASHPHLLAPGRADRWDSGIASTDACAGIAYSGNPLTSRERLFWSVTLWDQQHRPGVPATSCFEMGLCGPEDWTAQWIGAPPDVSSPLLRTEIELPADVDRARAYVAGLGHYELRINGQRVGDRLLDPATTTYDHDTGLRDEAGRATRTTGARVPYVVYDIDGHVRPGTNALGLVLGHGWFSAEPDVKPMPFGRSPYGDRPQARLQLELHTTSGEIITMVTDDRWRTTAGPVTYNDHFHGETHDRRLHPDGWDRPGFDDTTWNPATVVSGPGGELRSQLLEPIRVVDTLPPVAVADRPDGRRIIDFGQHVSGWTKLNATGPAGGQITVRHAGAVDGSGDLDDSANMLWRSQARQTDSYVLAGRRTEGWEPRFTLHGFRYAELSTSSPTVAVQDITARVAHSAVDSIGSFDCADDLLNAIHRNVSWTFRASLQGVPQDAADRAERVAWLGDPGWVVEDYLYELDGLAFWAKWLDDLADAQLPNGNLPMVAPIHWRGPLPDALPHVSHLPYATWPDFTAATYPLIAWHLYQFYGDPSVLDRHLPGMARAVDWMRSKAQGHIIHEGFGDHMEPQPDGTCLLEATRTPVDLTSTAWYVAATRAIADAGTALGRADVSHRYRRRAANIRQAFNRRFLDPDSGSYATGSQTSLAMPLWLDLVPDDVRAATARNLVSAIERSDWHLDTGTMGTAALQHALPAVGAADVMLRIARQRTFPSWGHQIEQGATTVWESWGGDPGRSLNMKLLCSINAFLYRDVAGLSPAAPGWSRIAVHPKVTTHLASASATVRTPRGSASIAWERHNTGLEVTLVIPPTSQATVTLPLAPEGELTVPGSGVVWSAGRRRARADFKHVRHDGRHLHLIASGGTHHLQLRGRPTTS